MATRLLVFAFLLVTICNVMDISARPAATADDESPAMLKFVNSLSPTDKALLMKMKSKTRYIKALLDNQKAATDKRDKVDVSDDDQCCNCLDKTAGCYDPEDKKRSHVIRCCGADKAGDEVARRSQKDEAVQLLSQMPEADRKLMENHKSKIKYLLLAYKQPSGTDGTPSAPKPVSRKELEPSDKGNFLQELRRGLNDLESKLDNYAEQQPDTGDTGEDQPSNDVLNEISDKFVDDVNLAKAKGVRLADLVSALKKRAWKR